MPSEVRKIAVTSLVFLSEALHPVKRILNHEEAEDGLDAEEPVKRLEPIPIEGSCFDRFCLLANKKV